MSKILAVALALFMLATSPYGQENEQTNPVESFLSNGGGTLYEYKATRHMEAANLNRNMSGFVDVEMELSRKNIFTYKIVSEGGSDYIRNNILRKVLEGEKKQLREDTFNKSAFTRENYTFAQIESLDGIYKVSINPKRKEGFLIKGFLLIKPDGELLLSEGMLVKNPSFWVRDANTTVVYKLIWGVRVPVSLESTARVIFAGKSSLSMKYRYISINGLPVPEPTKQ